MYNYVTYFYVIIWEKENGIKGKGDGHLQRVQKKRRGLFLFFLGLLHGIHEGLYP